MNVCMDEKGEMSVNFFRQSSAESRHPALIKETRIHHPLFNQNQGISLALFHDRNGGEKFRFNERLPPRLTKK